MEFFLLILLFTTSISAGILREDVFTKTFIYGNNGQTPPMVLRILEFASGIIIPIVPFLIHYIVFFFINKSLKSQNISKLSWIILIGLTPFYFSILVNCWFVLDISASTLSEMNSSGRGSIIPFLSLHSSSILMNVLQHLPSFLLLYFLIKKYKYSWVDSATITVIPSALMFLFSNYQLFI